MPIPKISYVLSDQGQFVTDGDPATTTPADMDSAFAQFKQQRDAKLAQNQTETLAVFFHGGLVDENDFMTNNMPGLLQGYQSAGFPYFFVWRSGAGETIMDWIRDHLGALMTNPKVSAAVQTAHDESQDPQYADALQSTQTFREFSALDTVQQKQTDSADLQARLTAKYRNDPKVQALQAVFDAHPAAQPRMLTLARPIVRPTIPGAPMSDEEVAGTVRDALGAPHTTGMRMLALPILVEVAPLLAKATIRVLWRNIHHRNHPGISTMSEEFARAFGIAKIGQDLWQTMKNDCSGAFDQTGVGTAFIQRLKSLASDGKPIRVLLIGHSAGSIYINDFLNAVAAMQMPSNVTFDVVFMAAAVRSDVFSALLQSQVASRMANFRSFALQDAVYEQGSGLTGIGAIDFFFPASLLYVISGILEPEPQFDVALAGMDRFIGVNTRFAGEAGDQVIINYATHARPAVWSPTSGAAPGYASNAKTHGGFPADTLSSTVTLIQGWV